MDDDTWESERGCSRLFGRGRVAQGAFIGESLLYHEVPRKHIVGWCLVGVRVWGFRFSPNSELNICLSPER